MSGAHKAFPAGSTETFRQRMDWLHLWGGLIAGWLLFVIFVAGSLSVFRAPVTRWMQASPVLLQEQGETPVANVVSDAALDALLVQLHARAPAAKSWSLTLPALPGDAVELSWRDADRRTHQLAADPGDGSLLPGAWGRRTEGGRHFMLLHYMLHAGMAGFWLVGAVAMAGLAALVSGIVVHKRIFKDFFTFRPGKGQRSWLDAHNVSGVLSLPFVVMIIYTGLAYFYSSYLPLPLRASYGTGDAAYQQMIAELHGDARATPLLLPSIGAGGLEAMAQLRRQALALTGDEVRRIFIQSPGLPDMVVRMMGRSPDELGGSSIHRQSALMVYEQASKSVVELARAGPPPHFTSAAVHPLLEQLHVAAFGGWAMKWLYFLIGLIGSSVIATGLHLFIVKRRLKSQHEFGAATPRVYRAIEVLNITAIAGSCVASIGFLYANRLIAAQFAQRADLEIRAYFILWLACLVHAAVRTPARAWREQAATLALLCMGLPLVNWASTGQHLLIYLRAGDWQRAGVELVALVIGVMALLAMRKLGRGRTA